MEIGTEIKIEQQKYDHGNEHLGCWAAKILGVVFWNGVKQK